ncbi:MAG: hypothetical protein WDM86_18210 [Rhizomicrobium sp.]
MFARAALALAVIAVLLPHAPDLGLGRASVMPALDPNGLVQACRKMGGSETDCQAATGSGDLQALVFDKLRAVKADLQASRASSIVARNSVGDERGDAAGLGPAIPPPSSH